MKHDKRNIDILKGSLIKNIILFVLPIALSSMLQQLFNAADTSVVGKFADEGALAAVGTNGEIVALLVTVSAGLSVGINVIIAGCIGRGEKDNLVLIKHSAIILSVIIGGIIAVSGQFLADGILRAINTPGDIFSRAGAYLKIYFAGMPFIMLYDFSAAILRAEGNSKTPFVILAISGGLNVLLNLLFVIVFKMGVTGVALATVISNGMSAVTTCKKVYKGAGGIKFKIMPELFPKVLKIGLPSAVQGAVFCFANIFVQTAVNGFGTNATGGSTIAMNFEYFAYYVITAFGQTATTFISQNYAAGNKDRCKSIVRICLIASIIGSGILTVPLTVFDNFFAGLFSDNTAEIQAACLRIGIILMYEPICGIYEVLAGVLRGIGHSTEPAVITILGTCVIRIVWIFTVFQKFHTLSVLFMVFPITWVITNLLMAAMYIRYRKIIT